MAKLIVLGGLIYGGYWLYKYMLAHPNIDKGKVIKTVGVIIVGLIALTKKNNTNSPKIMRTYRCRGCGRKFLLVLIHLRVLKEETAAIRAIDIIGKESIKRLPFRSINCLIE